MKEMILNKNFTMFLFFIFGALFVFVIMYLLSVIKNLKNKPKKEQSQKKEIENKDKKEKKETEKSEKQEKDINTLTPAVVRKIYKRCVWYIVIGVILLYFGMISPQIIAKLSEKLPYITIVFKNKIIFYVLGFSLIGGVANVFQSVIFGSKSLNFYNNIKNNKELFSDKQQYNYLLRKLLNSSYNKTWDFWINVQPILSMFVGIIVYFIFISGIKLSGSIPESPNIYFYGALAFLSGFFYEKFLDFLQKTSSQLLNNETYNDNLMEMLNEFETIRKGIIIDTTNKQETLASDININK